MTAVFAELFLCFILYSFLGWACESIWCSVGTRKLVNRGFLAGPLCPVYGFGALLILFICLPVQAYPPLVFLLATLSTSALEYFTGWLLEALFHTRWWDYSHRKFQLNGRVCLRNSLLFGLMGLVATYGLHPLVQRLLGSIPPRTQYIAAGILLLLLLADLAHTLATLLGLQRRLQTLHSAIAELAHYNDVYGWLDPRDIRSSVRRLREICANDAANEQARAILLRLDSLTQRTGSLSRILNAFPNLRHRQLGDELRTLREAIAERRKQKGRK